MPLDIPELLTDRLRLRGWEPRDLDEYAALMADPEVMRFLGDGRPLSRAEAWRHMALFVGHWALRGYGLWVVEERATGRLAGRIGCWEPEGWPGLEIGYTLGRPFWGRGYAREGAAAALRWARETLRRPEILSVIRPSNERSIAVATSIGGVRAETIDFLGEPALLYRYPAG